MSSPTLVPTAIARPAESSLDGVFRPRTVAVVGASPDPTKRGHRAVQTLRQSGYRGQVIPVHPAGGQLLGHTVARGPSDLDAAPDLALICTPAATVPAALEEWALAGTRAAVVLASGFGESGGAGLELEHRIRDVVARTGIRVVGPNTSGILNAPLGLNLIGVEGVAPGPLSLLVQSGNIALALMTEAAMAGLGFSLVIGVGNEVDIAYHEYLDYLASDDATHAVLVHAEGFRDGRAFLGAARRLAAKKPVAMIKGARSEAGGMAARSHTGAVAGSSAALEAGLHQAGVIEVRRTDELLPVMQTLIGQQPKRKVGIAVLSDGGGHATIAVDDLHSRGVQPAQLQPDTIAGLRELLGPAAAVTNPIDLAGAADRDPRVFVRALALLAADPGVGAVLLAGLFGGYAIRFSNSLLDAEIDAARRLPDIARDAGIALVVHTLYANSGSEPIRILRAAGVPVLGSLELASRSVVALAERGDALDRLDHRPIDWPSHMTAAAADPFTDARVERRSVLLEPEARAIAESFDVPLVPAEFCRTPNDAAAAAGRIGGAVVIRVVSPAAPHKTDAGGVALNVAVADAATTTVRIIDAVTGWAAANGADADVRGVLVSPMLDTPVAELLVGIVRDPQFGPVLTIGAGGTHVELHRDVVTRVLPVDAADIADMLEALRIAPLLAGHRGAAPAHVPSIIAAVLALTRCALSVRSIAEIEVNPLFARSADAIAVDVRIFID